MEEKKEIVEEHKPFTMDYGLYYTHGPNRNTIGYDNIRTPSGRKLISRNVNNK